MKSPTKYNSSWILQHTFNFQILDTSPELQKTKRVSCYAKTPVVSRIRLVRHTLLFRLALTHFWKILLVTLPFFPPYQLKLVWYLNAVPPYHSGVGKYKKGHPLHLTLESHLTQSRRKLFSTRFCLKVAVVTEEKKLTYSCLTISPSIVVSL